MMPHSIRHRLHEDAFLALYSSFSRFPRRSENGQCVVSVHSDGVEAVSRSTRGDPVPGILVDDRGGNSEAAMSHINQREGLTRYFGRTRYTVRPEPSSSLTQHGSLPH